MLKKISIRKAVNKDARAIEKIHKNCVERINAKFYPSSIIKEWLGSISAEKTKSQFKNSKWAVLLINKKIAGFVQFSPETKELFQINIDPSLNNKGYGKKLYEYVEKFFIKNNLKKISLNATLNAIEFYKKLGFKKNKKIKFKMNKESLEMLKMRKFIP